jgi:hypothetical protein
VGNYQCIDSEPGDPTVYKAGQIFNNSGKLTNLGSELDADGSPWRNLFSWACKPAMAVLAARKAKEQPQAQVASAQVKGGVSPETQKQIDSAIKNGYMTKTVDPTTKAVKYISTGKGPFTIGMFQNNLPKGKEIEMD